MKFKIGDKVIANDAGCACGPSSWRDDGRMLKGCIGYVVNYKDNGYPTSDVVNVLSEGKYYVRTANYLDLISSKQKVIEIY